MVGKLKVLLVCLLCLPLVGAWPNTGRKYPSGYLGPGDVVSGAVVWYGLRAYSSTLAASGVSTTPVIDVLGVNTVTGCTIYLKGDSTGGIDLTTAGPGGVGHQCALGATTFCTVTNAGGCTVSKIYDQSGHNLNLVQATAASQPVLAFSCFGSLPCLQPVQTVVSSLGAAAATATTQPFTVTAVAERTGNTSAFGTVIGCGAGISGASVDVQSGFSNSANNALLFAGTVVSVSGVNDNVSHSLQFVYNGASSKVDADGTVTSSLNPGAADCTAIDGYVWLDSGGNKLTGNNGEAGIWGVGFSANQLTNMQANMKAYWGTL